MPKAACECNSLTASRANNPRRDDFSGFPIRPRSISGILPIAAIAMARPFKILLYNDFQQNIARFRDHVGTTRRHGRDTAADCKSSSATPFTAPRPRFIRQAQNIR